MHMKDECGIIELPHAILDKEETEQEQIFHI